MWEMQALSTPQNQILDSSDLLCGSSSLSSENESNCDTKIHINNNNNCDNNMQIDVAHIPTMLNGTILPTNNGTISTLATTQQTTNNSTINLAIQNSEVETQTVALLEAPLTHPALRGVKTVNIGNYYLFFFFICLHNK